MSSVKLVIEFVDEGGMGKVNVNGPLENDILCYGLLEKAKQTIMEFNMKKQAGKGSIAKIAGGMNPGSTWRPSSS